MEKEKLNAKEKTDAALNQPATDHPTQAPEGMLEEGTEVIVNKTTLTGVVSGFHISADSKTLSYLVKYEDDGEQHERAFIPKQLTRK